MEESECVADTIADTAGGTSDAMQADDAGPSTSGSGDPKPTVILVIGMAGSGKTTLIQRLNAHLHAAGTPPYIINMDPAVTYMPYGANIDIRDTVKYKNVMKQYNLGPNGGILTACNLFATRFDQVIALCEKKREPPIKYIIVDTPGQIEIFTWSASGAIVTELFASSFPTCVAYVCDTPRCVAPQTFMSNMLQACSILYKTKLPMLLAFNKCDVTHHEFALTWMSDFEAYSKALEADATYAASLSRSLSLVLDEFYTNLRSVGVSAVTGAGMPEFFEAVDAAALEYHEFYVPDLERRKAEKAEREQRRKQNDVARLRSDMQGMSVAGPSGGTKVLSGGTTGGTGQPPGGAAYGGTKAAVSTTRVAGRGAAAAAAGGAGEAPEEEQQEEDDEFDYQISDDSLEEEDNINGGG